MSSTDSHRLATEDFLDPYVEAARRQFDAAEIEHAAQRLRERLPRARFGRPASLGWLSLAGAASILFAAIAVVSFFLPGDNGSAFAQAQQWFASFRTLQVEMTVETGQDAVARTNIWLDDSGDMRIESAGATWIVKPEAGMMYVLLPDGETIAQSIPPVSVAENSTGWIDGIRDFQGEAELVAESRFIEGISATGYSLTMGASTFVLWVDPFDNKPLLMESEMPGGVTMRNALSFDTPLPADVFDVPEGIQPLELHE
ncbi:MAG TPA: hypothetical protein VMR74_14380 [Gammaproteobacteria bacterium]|nr:hypothetical protein [Gammaproteobacteria bacterium]